MKKIGAILTGIGLALSQALFSVGAYAEQRLYVGNFGSGDISVISIPEHEVISKIEVGHKVDDVIGSPDGRMLYASLKVDTGHALGFETEGQVVAVDTLTEKVKWRIKLKHGVPNHISMTDDGMLYVPIFDRNWVDVIDTKKGKIVDRLDGGIGMHGTRLSEDGERLYSGLILGEALTVHNVKTKAVEKVIWFEDGVRPFAVTKDEKTVYLQLSKPHAFFKVDMEQGKIVQKIDMPEPPKDFVFEPPFHYSTNHGLELSPDETFIVANASRMDYISVFSHPELEYMGSVDVGDDPNWVLISDDSKTAYISNRGEGTISVIDVEGLTEAKRIETGGIGSARMRFIDVPSE